MPPSSQLLCPCVEEGLPPPLNLPVHVQAEAPFARHEHDREHEDMLRSKSRFGDPFAHLAARKGPAAGSEAAALTERYNIDALEKSGERVCQITMYCHAACVYCHPLCLHCCCPTCVYCYPVRVYCYLRPRLPHVPYWRDRQCFCTAPVLLSTSISSR